MRYRCKLNKMPFILWFTNDISMNVDFEKNTILSEDGLESNIKKVNPKFIFAIKYLPLLALFLLGLKLPNDNLEYMLFIGGFAIAYTLQYLFVKSIKLLKLVLVAMVIAMYATLFAGYAFEIEMSLLFTLEFIIMFFFYREFKLERYNNYYYLENFERKATLTLAKKRERPLIRIWGNKGFFKKELGFDASREFAINGYYIRVCEELKDA